MEEEIWKSIPNGGIYEISNKGQIRHGLTGDVRKLQLKGDNDKCHTNIVVNGKDFPLNVSRIVLETFVRKPVSKEHAGHKNGIRTDNRVENLEWRLGSTNDTCSASAKSLPLDVTICGTSMRFSSTNEAANYLGKSRDTIYRNDGKGEVNGISVEKVSVGPEDDIVKQTIKFGDKIVTVSADGWVKPGESRWKKVTTVRGGYLRTSFQFDRDGNTKRSDNGKVLSQYFELHRLVCEAFHGPPPANFDAHHINEVKSDNRPENLEWRSRSENMKASYEGGFNNPAGEKATYQYTTRGEFTGKVYKSASEAARSVRGVVSGVTPCCKGTKLSYMDFEWSYSPPEIYATQRVAMQARAREKNKEAVKKRRDKNGPPKSTGKPIYAYDATTFELRGNWPSGKAAAADTKCNTANISNCVNGRLKQTGGLIFTRKDEEAFHAEREV